MKKDKIVDGVLLWVTLRMYRKYNFVITDERTIDHIRGLCYAGITMGDIERTVDGYVDFKLKGWDYWEGGLGER